MVGPTALLRSFSESENDVCRLAAITELPSEAGGRLREREDRLMFTCDTFGLIWDLTGWTLGAPSPSFATGAVRSPRPVLDGAFLNFAQSLSSPVAVSIWRQGETSRSCLLSLF